VSRPTEEEIKAQLRVAEEEIKKAKKILKEEPKKVPTKKAKKVPKEVPKKVPAEVPIPKELVDLQRRVEELEKGQKFLGSQVTEIATELEKKPGPEQIKAIFRETIEEMAKEAEAKRAEMAKRMAEQGVTPSEAQAALALKSPVERIFGRAVSPGEFGQFLHGLGSFIQALRGGAITEEHPFYKAGETMFKTFTEVFTRIYTREFGKATAKSIHLATHEVKRAEGEKSKE